MNSNEATPVPTYLARSTRLLYNQRRPKSDIAITKVMRILSRPTNESPTRKFTNSRSSPISQTPNCEHTPVYFGRERGIVPQFPSKPPSQNLNYEEFAHSKSTQGLIRASNDQVECIAPASDKKRSIRRQKLPLQPTSELYSTFPAVVHPVEEAQIEGERLTLQQSELSARERASKNEKLLMKRLRAKRAIAKRIQGQRIEIKRIEAKDSERQRASVNLQSALSVDVDISEFSAESTLDCPERTPFVRPSPFQKLLRFVVSVIALVSFVSLNLSFA